MQIHKCSRRVIACAGCCACGHGFVCRPSRMHRLCCLALLRRAAWLGDGGSWRWLALLRQEVRSVSAFWCLGSLRVAQFVARHWLALLRPRGAKRICLLVLGVVACCTVRCNGCGRFRSAQTRGPNRNSRRSGRAPSPSSYYSDSYTDDDSGSSAPIKRSRVDRTRLWEICD